ncbi:hypothetical protein GCM10009754_68310 [Amycolatopsis minnesotensis]|uniref:Secreted protein n=1 Tax=Amycolatopsis minnesotensis TaxID=337894 RepID=A0ABP5DKF9_9PSEU
MRWSGVLKIAHRHHVTLVVMLVVRLVPIVPATVLRFPRAVDVRTRCAGTEAARSGPRQGWFRPDAGPRRRCV